MKIFIRKEEYYCKVYESYSIERDGNHLMLTSEHTVKEIGQKAKKVLGMLKRGGVKFTPTQLNVLAIIRKVETRKIVFFDLLGIAFPFRS